MKKCKKCQCQNPNDAEYCRGCGTSLVKKRNRMAYLFSIIGIIIIICIIFNENNRNNTGITDIAQEITNTEATYLNISVVSVSFPSEGGDKVLSISTDGTSLEVTSKPDWCTVTYDSPSSITITCDPNKGDSRSSSITISCDNQSDSFTIEQAEETNNLTKGNWINLMNKVTEYVNQNYSNGSYKGEINNELREGFGVYSWSSGGYFCGRWSNGSQNGIGIYFSQDKFINNCDNCTFYVGNWAYDYKNGNGTCYDKRGNLIYYGAFSEDKPTADYPTIGYDSYKFECLEYDSGGMYIGETKDGKKSGYGIYIWASGDSWYGPWKNDERDGYGVFLSYDAENINAGTWSRNTQIDKI
jgi:MORN repeat.